jgi:hypothetical protein
MAKKKVDPLLEPVLDKIEEFDPERADRLRENNADPRYQERAILEMTADGPRVTRVSVPEPEVTMPTPVPAVKKQRHDYRFCNHCGKKGAYTLKSAFETLEFCKYCRPKKKWNDIPAGLLEPTVEPKKKSWLARLLRR